MSCESSRGGADDEIEGALNIVYTVTHCDSSFVTEDAGAGAASRARGDFLLQRWGEDLRVS